METSEDHGIQIDVLYSILAKPLRDQGLSSFRFNTPCYHEAYKYPDNDVVHCEDNGILYRVTADAKILKIAEYRKQQADRYEKQDLARIAGLNAC